MVSSAWGSNWTKQVPINTPAEKLWQRSSRRRVPREHGICGSDGISFSGSRTNNSVSINTISIEHNCSICSNSMISSVWINALLYAGHEKYLYNKQKHEFNEIKFWHLFSVCLHSVSHGKVLTRRKKRDQLW